MIPIICNKILIFKYNFVILHSLKHNTHIKCWFVHNKGIGCKGCIMKMKEYLHEVRPPEGVTDQLVVKRRRRQRRRHRAAARRARARRRRWRRALRHTHTFSSLRATSARLGPVSVLFGQREKQWNSWYVTETLARLQECAVWSRGPYVNFWSKYKFIYLYLIIYILI